MPSKVVFILNCATSASSLASLITRLRTADLGGFYFLNFSRDEKGTGRFLKFFTFSKQKDTEALFCIAASLWKGIKPWIQMKSMGRKSVSAEAKSKTP